MKSQSFKTYLQQQIVNALESLQLPIGEVQVERSKAPEFGDLSSNIALKLAKQTKTPPIELAKQIKEAINLSPDYCTNISISPPGFLNFSYSQKYLYQQLTHILSSGERYGQTDSGKGKTGLVEFVSANPTGPLTVGHGRQAVLGDIVSNILQWHGYDVTREYYFNDAGRQMRLLGQSVYTRYMESLNEPMELPEGGYEGNYIREIADDIRNKYNDSLKDKPDSPIFRKTAEDTIFNDIKSTLEHLGISFNNFVNEKTFYENGAIESVVARLREKNLVYDKDGAVWFKTTELGKSQDTVLIKSSGEPTYRLPDMAYHEYKVKRGFDIIVDIFGADHKDTYPDVISALNSLGLSTDHIRVLIHQFVTLMQKGQRVKMSTRKATFVTLDELTETVGTDVVRYFFIMRNMKSHLNFDLELATKESDENPVYYLQYAHARICNIIKYGKEMGISIDGKPNFDLLQDPAEIKLLKELIRFPEITNLALSTLEPQVIANFLQSVAALFHKFYSDCRVITNDVPLSNARLSLIAGVNTILANGLKILGISRPERM